jgi:uncharacterized membrane protein
MMRRMNRSAKIPDAHAAVPTPAPAVSGSLAIEPLSIPVLATLVTCGLYMFLPSIISLGPRWLLLVVVVILLIPLIIFRLQKKYVLSHVCGHLSAGVITIFSAYALFSLLRDLPRHHDSPVQMLRAAGLLWVINVLIFAFWYWRLDGGGPHARAARGHYQTGCFLFPQMTMKNGDPAWSPRFLDYLFVAFTTSTAFSPTDTPVLSRWAKLLTMLQAIISLGVVVLVAGRAVNII